MPHQSIKLADGVNQNRTPTQNEFGISFSQLIRFQYDSRGEPLVQKLGGWTRYYDAPMTATPRALWGWESTEANLFLAVGTENAAGTLQAQLNVISNRKLIDITPRQDSDDITAAASTTAGSSLVTITDATIQNITQYDAVYIPTHISIGGLVLFGLYACDPDGSASPTTYKIQAVDKLGNPLAATSTTTTTALASLSVTSGSTVVTVTLNNHGYNVGDVFPILVPTTVGGALFYSHYPVQSVINANSFTITASQTPTSTTSGSINNDYAQYIYCFGVGAVPPGSGFGIGGFGRGGFGTGVSITPYTGLPIGATNWTLDNWGEILVGCADPTPLVLTITGISGNGATGTVTFSESYTPPVNVTIVISGVTPSSWNGTHIVTASSSGSVSFATANTDAWVSGGSVTIENAPFAPIYMWDSEGGAPKATVISQAPPVNAGIFVAMPQRQIVAWGSTFTGISDPLLLRWCDVNNFDVWIGQATNQAGFYRLTKGSRIVGGIQGPQQGLVWTDIDLWAMQYINPPLVYGFNEIGTGCGLIAKKAAASVNGQVFWMGPSQFFVLNENGVQPLPCPVWDVVYQNLDLDNVDRIRIAVNSLFNEVAWYYPTSSSNGEVAAYVKYNYQLGWWDYGPLARSAWIDQSVLGPPIGTDPVTGYIYQHETSPDADGQAMVSFCRTGYVELDDGDQLTFVDQVWPDAKWGTYSGAQNATLNLTIYGTDYAGATAETNGPYSLIQSTQYVTPRMRKRLIAFEFGSSDIGSFWRLGRFRVRYQPDGKF